MLIAPVRALADEVVFDRILVKVNDDIITQYDLDEEIKPVLAKLGNRQLSVREQEQLDQFRKQVLERMVNDKLMEQEIKKFEIVISDDAVDAEIKKIKKEQGYTDEDFNEMLKKDNLTLEDFRTKLRGIIEKQELLGYMVHSKVLVTDSEIKEEYDAHHDDYVLEKLISLAIIVLPPDVAATEVKKRIEDGELTFAEAAEKYSIGPGKENGGSIGEVAWNDLADDWQRSLDGIKEGGVSAPIEVQGNKALLSPVKVIEDRLIPLDEVRDEIFKRLMDAKREKVFDEYFEQLKQSSVIEYME
ncbi:SurA N-terminal domain-containing protein [Pseudodesulfovibrio cashew]|nr:SurA N-terminal domain-containing protein [Pseudodesulfovibrio cashew]